MAETTEAESPATAEGMSGTKSANAPPGKSDTKAANAPPGVLGVGKKDTDPLWPPPLAVWLPFIMLLCGFAPVYYRYGVNYFLPAAAKSLHLNSTQWQQEVLPRHTLLFIGGHHRAGTTLLWNLIREHELVGSFAAGAFQTGSDYSEGAFLQDVVPTFGVGEEQKSKPGRPRHTGLGTYALSEARAVHWTDESPRAEMLTASTQARLLNAWGYHWNAAGSWHKPFWLEKTPTNAVSSRFLEALVNLGIGEEQLAPSPAVPWPMPRNSRARFVFLQRHPIANALAHKQMAQCRRLPLEKLVENWVAVSAYAEQDTPKLTHGWLVVKVEALAKSPRAELRRVCDFFGLPRFGDSHSSPVIVDPEPNAKYVERYCSSIQGSGFRSHRQLRARFSDDVRHHGYNLDEWPCIHAAEYSEKRAAARDGMNFHQHGEL